MSIPWLTMSARIVGWLQRFIRTVGEAVRSFGRHRGGRLAAAVSYRTIFALTPLLLIAVSVFGWVVGDSEVARERILESIAHLIGPGVADAIDSFMISAAETGGVAAIVGFLLFIWTASTLFIEIQNGLNDIFSVPYEETSGVIGFLRKRGIGSLWAIGLGLLTVAVWLLNAIWGWLADLIVPDFEPLQILVGWLTPLVSLVLFPAIFALSFKTMVVVPISWRAAWNGGLFTALVFVGAALGARIYFAWNSETSASQVAGAVFVVLLLAYFLSSAFFIGAHMTRIFNDRYEGSVRPASG